VPHDDSHSLHVHSKPVLSFSRGHLRHELSHGHRYVEPGLYTGGAQDRIPHLSWRKRARAIVLHNGGPRTSRQGLCQSKLSQATLFWYVQRFTHSFGPLFSLLDSTGAPRPVVNSKGRRRRPGTKSLAQVLRCDDELFVDFVSKCLVWDPERRIKPQNAMRHPFITAGKRSKGSTPSSTTAKALLSTASSLASRSKPPDTPKKSQISAPTPLTARISRTTNAQPSTPGGASTSMHSLGSARSYRTSQSQTISSYHPSRAISGFAVR
jgi:serine/threonine protein kinase